MGEVSGWHGTDAGSGYETRTLKDSYWAEVHPDGSWKIYGIADKNPLKRGFSGSVRAAKKAVDDWEKKYL